MQQYGIGQPVRRKEDVRFVTGHGRYIDDISLPRQLHATLLRSTHAHADIVAIDSASARALPGVVAVYTAADLSAAGLGMVPTRTPAKNSNGNPVPVPDWSALASDRVRYVGEAVAMVVAATTQAAEEALELISVDYSLLPAVTDAMAALSEDAPQIWPDVAHNVCVDFAVGDSDAVNKLMASAAHVVSLDMNNQRVTAAPLEPRGAIGSWDAEKQTGEVILSSQNVHANRNQIANDMFGIESDDLRVVAYDVGGGFGVKNPLYPEYALVLFAARALNRPVKWINDRSGSFMSDSHGRDQRSTVRLALDENGRFLALDVQSVGNIGPYVMSVGPFTPTGGSARTQGGAYRFEAIHFHSRAVFTNTTPTDPYRGAGRPEASYQIERIIDYAADELGMCPVALRRLNALSADDVPYTSPVGAVVDSGDCRLVLEKALEYTAWDRFEARAAYSQSQNSYRGIGLGLYLECGGGGPKEHADISVLPDGRVRLAVGSQSTGMGHETTLCQLLAHKLGIGIEQIVYVQGDTAATPIGGGHGGSRSLEMGGGAVLDAVAVFIDEVRPIAAQSMEAAAEDVEYDAGHYRVKGTDKSISVTDLLITPGSVGDALAAVSAAAVHERSAISFPNGCHVCEVEVDIDTGHIELISYHVVDDFGTIVNPLTAAGQVMGGTVQGLGQAMMEAIRYDDSGQLVSGSFMDYCMPRADDLCAINVAFFDDAPTASNTLGVKGSGEAGCCGALPALVNAVVDALSSLGVRHIEMPLTPESVWSAVQKAQNRG